MGHVGPGLAERALAEFMQSLDSRLQTILLLEPKRAHECKKCMSRFTLLNAQYQTLGPMHYQKNQNDSNYFYIDINFKFIFKVSIIKFDEKIHSMELIFTLNTNFLVNLNL